MTIYCSSSIVWDSFDENKSAEKVNASRKTLSAHTVLLNSWVCNKTSTIKKRFINSNTSILLCLISITILWSVAFFLSKGFEK